MTVLTSLAREHRVFEGLARRLELALRFDPERARRELREVLLVLLPALERHESLEEEVFDRREFRATRGAGPLLAENARQHRRLMELKARLQEALEGLESHPFGRLRAAAAELTEGLRAHFLSEERRLWPRYYRAVGRSFDRALERRARRSVAELERGVRRGVELAADYLGGLR